MACVLLVAAACAGGEGADDVGAPAVTDPSPPAPDPASGVDDGAGTGGAATATTEAPSTLPTPASGPAAESGDAPSEPGPSPWSQPLPTTVDGLADALSEAELAIRDTTRSDAERGDWGRRQQQLYRVLAANEAWAAEVPSLVDPAVSSAVERNWAARTELNVLLLQHEISDTLPAWRVTGPAPADELLGYYREAGERHGVPWEILAAINLIETRMGRINGISTAGALGPMQFLPTTWAECCEGDPLVPRDAINGAAKYLVDRGAATDLDRAIWGYNNSDRYVAAVTTYAAVLEDDPEAYYGYHGWQVYFLSTAGLALLPEGYEEPEPVDAAGWLAANPQNRLTLES